MIKFTATIADDIPQIQRWIDADDDHREKMDGKWWLQGSVLNCCAEDKAGPVMYLRIDRESDRVRLHIQFAPTNEVSRIRVAGAFIDGLPRMLSTMKGMGFRELVFESCSKPLVAFMSRFGFRAISEREFVRPLTI